MATNALGELLRGWREQERISLRKFAFKVGIDPANYSRIERGMGPRPEQEVLERIACGFGIEPNHDPRWFEMHDSVWGDRATFPPDLLEDQELAKNIPAFFQKIRSKGAKSPEELYDLWAEALRGK